MTGKTYAILGGGGSFGIHTAFYLLDHANPKKVIGIGRNPLRQSAFSLDIDKRDGYEYHARHITYELDLLLELLDREKPDVIVNFAAQGEGAVSWKHSWRFFETNSMALARLAEELMKRDWLERFIQIGTSEMYGSVDHATTEDEPIKPSSPYAASKVAFDMYLVSVHRFLKFPMNIIRPSNAYCPGQLLHRVIPKAVWCGLTGRRLAVARRRPRREILHPRPRPRPRHPSRRGKGAARHDLQCRPARTDLDPRGSRALRAGARNAVRGIVRGDRRPPRPGRALLARQQPHQARCRLGGRRSAGTRGWRRWSPGAGAISTTSAMSRAITCCGAEPMLRNSFDADAARARCRRYRRRILDISQQVGALACRAGVLLHRDRRHDPARPVAPQRRMAARATSF